MVGYHAIRPQRRIVVDDTTPWEIPDEVDELGAKCRAAILLADRLVRLVIPDYEEWAGIALLDRDGELLQHVRHPACWPPRL